MGTGSPPNIGRDTGTQPLSAIALSHEVTIHILAPLPRQAVRRPAPAPPPPVAGRFGAGLVDMPTVTGRDPADAVLAEPAVTEARRFCVNCGSPVGRGRNGAPGAVSGFCPRCGTPFSFAPALRPGEVVGGRYEVAGVLAHGGMGWLYLARDHDRWVVLKGLIDSTDAAAAEMARTEAEVLTRFDHPNIVKVLDVVRHPGAGTGYLVMEYVNGLSLREIALAHHRELGRAESLPVGQVIAYGLEILSVLGYLHAEGFLYCDVKPDNVIHTGNQVKLIDFGSVRRMDDVESPIFLTVGYGAPELATEGPSIASDLYAVGRTLAVLSFEFHGYTTTYKDVLPQRDSVPLLARFESYYRFLRRATHEDPSRRFRSAAEMAEQLAGVLREIRSLETGVPTPGPSTVFTPAPNPFGELVIHHGTPTVLPPDADEVIAGLPTVTGELDDWHAGLTALAAGRPGDAEKSFARVYDELPGETAPKLAIAASAELAGADARAAEYYDIVWRTDHSCLSAAFGLARLRQAQGDHEGAAAVLRSLHLTVRGGPDDPVAPHRGSRWRLFVGGLAESLVVARPPARRRHRPGWRRIEARLHEAYARLGPPGKDAQR